MAKKYLAVYGSLRRGQRANNMMDTPALTFVGEGFISAKLYALGWYPGIALSNDPDAITKVDVYEVLDENGLNHLHRYEGYVKDHPEQSLFILRNNVPLLDDDKEVMCYEYNFGKSNERPDHLIVKHGDWSRYLSERNQSKAA
jgi:gamma-glutamylcyclotransferase (GGCT)/AIG2-like uncharacterized protein YtfP